MGKRARIPHGMVALGQYLYHGYGFYRSNSPPLSRRSRDTATYTLFHTLAIASGLGNECVTESTYIYIYMGRGPLGRTCLTIAAVFYSVIRGLFMMLGLMLTGGSRLLQ